MTTQFSRRLSYATAAVAANVAVLWHYIRDSYQGTGHGRRLAHLGNRRFRDRMDLGGFTYRRSLGDRILRMGVIGLSLAAGTMTHAPARLRRDGTGLEAQGH